VISGPYTISVTDVTVSQAPSLSGLAHLSGIGISDTAAHVGAAIDALAGMTQVNAITLTDGGIPTLSLTAAQLAADGAVLQRIQGNFDLLIDASAPNLIIQGYQPGNGAHGNIAVFQGTASEYQLAAESNGTGVTVTDTGTGRASVDTLSGIDALQFSDLSVIVAPAPATAQATGGNITELYGAVFGRVPDAAGLSYYETELAQNPSLPLTTFAEDFLQSPEYTASAPAYAWTTAGESAFITDTYQKLLGRAPESGAIPYYLNLITQLTQGVSQSNSTAYAAADLFAHATVLVDISNSAEFLGDVQISGQHPASSQHWLLLL
jgi:hypothetical protein